jgi:hypothetical protein
MLSHKTCFSLLIFCSVCFVTTQAQSVKCNPAAKTPIYDFTKVSLLDSNGVRMRDSLVDPTPKFRNVFKPCREHVYKAIYRTASDSLISERLVSVLPTGNRWQFQPEQQDEIVITYHKARFEQKDMQRFNPNRKLARTHVVIPNETTGIIENEKKLWMHPLRGREYSFTEVAPFPKIEYPLEDGATWIEYLSVQEGWGDWDGSTIASEYKVIGKEAISLAYKPVTEAWRIESNAEASFGKTYLTYWFSPEYGFVKMVYTNYIGQTLSFELVAVKSH